MVFVLRAADLLFTRHLGANLWKRRPWAYLSLLFVPFGILSSEELTSRVRGCKRKTNKCFSAVFFGGGGGYRATMDMTGEGVESFGTTETLFWYFQHCVPQPQNVHNTHLVDATAMLWRVHTSGNLTKRHCRVHPCLKRTFLPQNNASKLGVHHTSWCCGQGPTSWLVGLACQNFSVVNLAFQLV